MTKFNDQLVNQTRSVLADADFNKAMDEAYSLLKDDLLATTKQGRVTADYSLNNFIYLLEQNGCKLDFENEFENIEAFSNLIFNSFIKRLQHDDNFVRANHVKDFTDVRQIVYRIPADHNSGDRTIPRVAMLSFDWSDSLLPTSPVVVNKDINDSSFYGQMIKTTYKSLVKKGFYDKVKDAYTGMKDTMLCYAKAGKTSCDFYWYGVANKYFELDIKPIARDQVMFAGMSEFILTSVAVKFDNDDSFISDINLMAEVDRDRSFTKRNKKILFGFIKGSDDDEVVGLYFDWSINTIENDVDKD